MPKLIPLFENYAGIICHRKQDDIAKEITQEALQSQLNPWKVTTLNLGNYLQLKGE